MSPTRKRFFRDSLLGISLTLISLLSIAAITVVYLNHKSYSAPVRADGKALDGPGIGSRPGAPHSLLHLYFPTLDARASPFFQAPLWSSLA
jgi:hypothetical protein